MWALLMATVATASAPPNIRLDDIEKWENAAEQLLDMPPGCWEWVGQASWDWHTGKYGKTRGDAVFAGKTVDGQWGEIALQPLGELQQRNARDREQRVYADKARFVPMVGRLPGGRVVVAGDDDDAGTVEDTEALNVLRQVLSRIGGEAFTSWAEWDEARGGVVLNRAIPLASNRKEEVKVQIFFPSGGDVPSLLDVRFPAKFKAALRGKNDDTQLGKIRMGLFAWTIKNAEVHVRGLIRGNVVYPSSEAFRFKFGFLGFRYHGAQTVVYKQSTRCENQPLSEEGAVAPPPAEAMVQSGNPLDEDAVAEDGATPEEGATPEDGPTPEEGTVPDEESAAGVNATPEEGAKTEVPEEGAADAEDVKAPEPPSEPPTEPPAGGGPSDEVTPDAPKEATAPTETVEPAPEPTESAETTPPVEEAVSEAPQEPSPDSPPGDGSP
ncbi:MAG: hypothetical protein AAGA48_21665 [Myxococcota bacterium]